MRPSVARPDETRAVKSGANTCYQFGHLFLRARPQEVMRNSGAKCLKMGISRGGLHKKRATCGTRRQRLSARMCVTFLIAGHPWQETLSSQRFTPLQMASEAKERGEIPSPKACFCAEGEEGQCEALMYLCPDRLSLTKDFPGSTETHLART